MIAYADGAPVYLSDVARVEDGHEDQRMRARYNGQPAVGFGVLKQSDGNTVAIADEMYRRLDGIKKTLPDGLTRRRGRRVLDFSAVIREAVEETISRSSSARCSRCSRSSCSCAARGRR